MIQTSLRDKYKGLLWFRFSGDDVGKTDSKDIPEDIGKTGMTVYPSLAEQDIHVSFSAPFTGSMVLTDLSGKVIRRRSIRHRKQVEVAVSDLSPGFYILTAMHSTENHPLSPGILSKNDRRRINRERRRVVL